MGKNTAVFVTDQRQEQLAELLNGKVRRLDWRREARREEVAEVFGSCARMVLPIPISKLERNFDVSRLLKEELTKRTAREWTVFAGAVSTAWRQLLQTADICWYDLMEEEEAVRQNARITAEATIAEILRYSPYSIRCQKILVCGFGRCGREIAKLLSAMGAKVTVLARSPQARKQARRCGYEAADFSYAPEEAYGSRTIVNTVPAPVIREPFIREMHKDAVIIDIASRPGGTDLIAAEAYGIKVVAALGLPGKYTPKSSAKVLADAMERLQPSQEGGVEKPWIFQIII